MPLPDRVRLVVLFGGQSAEHEVSCVSAYHVLQAVDPERYAVQAIGITREGAWVRNDDAVAALTSGAGALPGGRIEATGTDVEPLPAVLPAGADDAPVVVLPLVHGTKGEDGTLQGMLDLLGVAYAGAGVLGSAVCMDKLAAKELLRAARLPQVRHVGLRDTELDLAGARVEQAALAYPLFVKPANLGSSVGITKVTAGEELATAVAAAAEYDEWVVIEEGVDAREIEVGVIGNASPRASVPGEIVPTHDFYDYDDKYLDGAAQMVIPADLPGDVADDARRLAVDAFRALRCDGFARVDFFYETTGPGRGLLVNEVNTIPGFTPGSMFPGLWAASGLDYAGLIDELVRLALERHEHRTHLSTKR